MSGESSVGQRFEALQNIGWAVSWAAETRPEQIAVAEPDGRSGSQFRTISFHDLDRQSSQVATGLLDSGVSPQSKISLMIPPGIDFVVFVFGLFKARVQAILIDPGMGPANLLQCLSQAEPDGLIGVRRAHLARRLFHRRLPACRHNFVVGRSFLAGAQDTKSFWKLEPSSSLKIDMDRETPAAIIFTSGSTGVPKGVLYRHRHFIEQAEQIRDYFRIDPGGVDISGFPLFALFNAAMGTTTVFPKMDATRPASINPRHFLAAVREFKANQSFGSPALWNTVSKFCERHGQQLGSIRRVLTAGAPVPVHVLGRVRKVIHPQAEVHTPYGATEALPVACIESREVLEDTAKHSALGRGTCVGKPFPKIAWKVIPISDLAIPNLSEVDPLPTGKIGELIVSGPVVTDRYVTRTEANAAHKIHDVGRIWHRMGDVGYLDELGRFWFCGRKSHRVTTRNGTLFTIPCEAIVNQHPFVYRSALVGVGPEGCQIPAFIVEPWPESWPKSTAARSQLILEIGRICSASPLTEGIRHHFLMRSLPVDRRHNSKIFREKLRVWAGKRLRVPDA